MISFLENLKDQRSKYTCKHTLSLLSSAKTACSDSTSEQLEV